MGPGARTHQEAHEEAHEEAQEAPPEEAGQLAQLGMVKWSSSWSNGRQEDAGKNSSAKKMLFGGYEESRICGD
jgi:hypothetical protein